MLGWNRNHLRITSQIIFNFVRHDIGFARSFESGSGTYAQGHTCLCRVPDFAPQSGQVVFRLFCREFIIYGLKVGVADLRWLGRLKGNTLIKVRDTHATEHCRLSLCITSYAVCTYTLRFQPLVTGNKSLLSSGVCHATR